MMPRPAAKTRLRVLKGNGDNPSLERCLFRIAAEIRAMNEYPTHALRKQTPILRAIRDAFNDLLAKSQQGPEAA